MHSIDVKTCILYGAMDTFESKRIDEVQFIQDSLLDKMKVLQYCEVIMVTWEGESSDTVKGKFKLSLLSPGTLTHHLSIHQRQKCSMKKLPCLRLYLNLSIVSIQL